MERLVVVPHQPGRRRRWLAGALAGVVLLAILGFFLGLSGGVRTGLALGERLEQAEQELQRRAGRISELESQLAIAEMGAKVDRAATENVRRQLKEEQDLNSALQEQIDLYQGLMSPRDNRRGLDIHSLRLMPAADAGSYRLVLVLQQLATRHAWLNVDVDVGIVGRQRGEEVELPLADLVRGGGESGNRLKFRYYVTFEREIVLPPGFAPLRLNVAARTIGAKPQRVEHSFDWQVQES
jgi:hypothetical protein